MLLWYFGMLVALFIPIIYMLMHIREAKLKKTIFNFTLKDILMFIVIIAASWASIIAVTILCLSKKDPEDIVIKRF